MKPILLKRHDLMMAILLIAGCTWFGTPMDVAAETEVPVITAVHYDSGQLRIEAQVPAGIRKVTLKPGAYSKRVPGRRLRSPDWTVRVRLWRSG